MSLSVANRQRAQTNSKRVQLPVRKQHSFIEPSTLGGKYSAQQRGYLSRGLSIGRSIENIRQKLYPPLDRQPKLSGVGGVGHLSRQSSVDAAQKFSARIVNSKPTVAGKGKSAEVWSSKSSLLKTLDDEIKDFDGKSHSGNSSRRDSTDSTAKADKNRINLNIVLAQTIRATTEIEAGHSDIESSTECSSETQASDQVQVQVQSSTTSNNSATLTVSSALSVQRRPPLVRAMSAPVRGLDENSKSVIAANKRQQKLRRRKIFTRSTASSLPPEHASGGTLLLSASSTGGGISNSNSKKVLQRARTVVAPDVITLVSLLSSEGSDSEHEDNSTASTPPGGAADQHQQQSQSQGQRSPLRRAPLLRKTGKSVSFQDSYPPTFQLASKEYSHMIRRGSIAPLAARIRSNRPPTAPPVSIFLTEPRSKCETMAAAPTAAEDPKGSTASGAASDEFKTRSSEKENENNAANWPVYVRSIKERECWKLFQKMCAKGVSVTYDTVLRGMLTPTEFRHFQKQREYEEAKAHEAAEAAAAAAVAESHEKERKGPTTAVERLSESLLNSK
ncbi:uncharacterized protein LOC115633885 [Scaptodrosophila lebanonensis]|uniref:Uncharacterized protein LOC115633885 n=1 Tax=Drosophila lebanonensis TaxID=7225 RepID=A0A6J2UIC9_DROLE|nr:uncharacterized protein LOC115633885 [Scaptodrosophila lebanonensis]